MAKYSSEEKLMIIEQYLNGAELGELAEQFGPAQETIKRWVKEYVLSHPEELWIAYQNERRHREALVEELHDEEPNENFEFNNFGPDALASIQEMLGDDWEYGSSFMRAFDGAGGQPISDNPVENPIPDKVQIDDNAPDCQIVMTVKEQRFLGLADWAVTSFISPAAKNTFTYLHDANVKINPEQPDEYTITTDLLCSQADKWYVVERSQELEPTHGRHPQNLTPLFDIINHLNEQEQLVLPDEIDI